MNIPIDLLYTHEHEWININNNIGIVGITDYAQNELGDIVFVELPNIGDDVIKGNSIGNIEAVKTVAEIYTPVSGEIIEVNTILENNPERLNTDPYKTGWLYKIKINDNNKINLLTDKEYENIII